MSIPIRIQNEHTKDIRVVQLDRENLPVKSYRIAPGQLSPTFDAEAPGLHDGHALVVTDEERLVCSNPVAEMEAAKTDPSELADSDVENEQDETRA